MRTKLLTVLAVVLLLSVGAGVAVAISAPSLRASGPTSVAGTEASSVFTLGDRTIRQVRYADKQTLSYSFTLHNDGWLPLTVTGLVEPDPQPRLFSYLRVTDESGAPMFDVPARSSRTVTVELLMRGCETLSARAGSMFSEVTLDTRRTGAGAVQVRVPFPEEVRAGSPREASCANATASSRPPG